MVLKSVSFSNLTGGTPSRGDKITTSYNPLETPKACSSDQENPKPTGQDTMKL